MEAFTLKTEPVAECLCDGARVLGENVRETRDNVVAVAVRVIRISDIAQALFAFFVLRGDRHQFHETDSTLPRHAILGEVSGERERKFMATSFAPETAEERSCRHLANVMRELCSVNF